MSYQLDWMWHLSYTVPFGTPDHIEEHDQMWILINKKGKSPDEAREILKDPAKCDLYSPPPSPHENTFITVWSIFGIYRSFSTVVEERLQYPNSEEVAKRWLPRTREDFAHLFNEFEIRKEQVRLDRYGLPVFG